MGELTQIPQNPYELDNHIRDALNAAKKALWALDLSNGILKWTGKMAPHLSAFARSIDGTISNYISRTHEDDLVEVLDLIENAEVVQAIDDLTDVLKVPQERVDKHHVDFRELLTQVEEKHKGLITEAGAFLEAEFRVESIEYASAYMESILSNLLTNSLKYRSNLVECEIYIKTFKDVEENIILEWGDNGIGIDLDRYGDDVFNLGKTFHTKTDGRGVGLFLVKNQVNAMGGVISVESKPGQGAKFTLNLTHDLTEK